MRLKEALCHCEIHASVPDSDPGSFRVARW